MKTFNDYLEESAGNASDMITGKVYKPKMTEDEVDPEELARGIKIEMEHTNDASLAKIIALHHISEFHPKSYYLPLIEMEKKLKGK